MSPLDAHLSRVVAPVEQGLESMRKVLIETLRTDTPAVSDMTDHISRFRGKQLRGALVLLAADALGNRHEELPQVAAIVELIHLATLVHDDVLDEAAVRRRVASVNQRWDNQVAVLLGDFLYARAFHLSTTLSSRIASQVLSIATQKICAGEIEQAAHRYDFEQSQEHSESIAGAKTAVLYSVACELGARYPARDDQTCRMFSEFGWAIGLAFQIADDVLDVVGNAEVVGKAVGTDVQDGKVTLPVLYVYQAADRATRSRIRDAYTMPDIENRAETLSEVCDLQPGVEYALARARVLVDGALATLETLPASPARNALQSLGPYVLERRW
ncbi:MAG: polyprenyl synthetase family protein [Planctomycetota bacterium]